MKRVSDGQSNRPQRDGNLSVYSSVGPASEVKGDWGDYLRSGLRRGTGLVAQWLLATRMWLLGLGHWFSMSSKGQAHHILPRGGLSGPRRKSPVLR